MSSSFVSVVREQPAAVCKDEVNPLFIVVKPFWSPRATVGRIESRRARGTVQTSLVHAVKRHNDALAG